MFLQVDENDSHTIDEFRFIINARYKVWLRESQKIQEDELKQYEKLLYSKTTSDDAEQAVNRDQLDSAVLDEIVHDSSVPEIVHDSSVPEIVDEFSQPGEENLFRCLKRACKRFNTVFDEAKYTNHLM